MFCGLGLAYLFCFVILRTNAFSSEMKREDLEKISAEFTVNFFLSPHWSMNSHVAQFTTKLWH